MADSDKTENDVKPADDPGYDRDPEADELPEDTDEGDK